MDVLDELVSQFASAVWGLPLVILLLNKKKLHGLNPCFSGRYSLTNQAARTSTFIGS